MNWTCSAEGGDKLIQKLGRNGWNFSFERPWKFWVDNITVGLGEIVCEDKWWLQLVLDRIQWLTLELALEVLLLDSYFLRKAFVRLSLENILRKRITERLKAFIPVCNSVEGCCEHCDERCWFTAATNPCLKKACSRVEVERRLNTG
jgi:hypothetical protein